MAAGAEGDALGALASEDGAVVIEDETGRVATPVPVAATVVLPPGTGYGAGAEETGAADEETGATTEEVTGAAEE